MAQQINLYSPILLQPKRYFSALAMVQAMAALMLGLFTLGSWVEYATAQQRRELAATHAAQSADRQRLQAELASAPGAAKDYSALDQELLQARSAVAERQRLLGEQSNPRASASRAAVLRLIAQSAPDKLWLTEVRLADGHVELAGISLQPEQLRPWFSHLLSQPALQATVIRSVVVDAVGRAESGREEVVREGTWSFRMIAQTQPEEPTGLAGARPDKTGHLPSTSRGAREGTP